MIFAGIGSRETPDSVLSRMVRISRNLRSRGWVLRSGGAVGADMAFEASYISTPHLKEIFLASTATPEAIELASRYHPAWNKCSEYVRKLHGRNMMIMLGRNLDKPVDYVICWTRDGKASGGTGQALRLAYDRNIRVYNLFFDIPDLDEWKS